MKLFGVEIKDYSKELKDIENKKANEKELLFVPLRVSFLVLKLIGLYLFAFIMYNICLSVLVTFLFFLLIAGDSNCLIIFILLQVFYNLMGLLYVIFVLAKDKESWIFNNHKDIVSDIKDELNQSTYYTKEEKEDIQLKRKYEKELNDIRKKYEERLAETKLKKAKKIENYLLVNSKEYIEKECFKKGNNYAI